MQDLIPEKPDEKTSLKELALLFLKLGLTSFGGPVAHIAIMENEVVKKRNWLSEQHFLDLIGATNLIPGPNSTEMAIHIGQERDGWKGLIVTGMCFILPAVLITGIFAVLYKEYGRLPQLQPFLYGISPAIISIILGAIYPLARKSLKTIELGIIGVIALILSLIGYNEIYVMFGAGFFSRVPCAAASPWHRCRRGRTPEARPHKNRQRRAHLSCARHRIP